MLSFTILCYMFLNKYVKYYFDIESIIYYVINKKFTGLQDVAKDFLIYSLKKMV